MKKTGIENNLTWAAVRGALKAALLIAGVFVGTFLVFILLCLFFWTR